MCASAVDLGFLVGYIARGALVQAIANKCGISTGLLTTLECSRLRGGHWELFVGGIWRRSTDLLNTTASS